MMAFLLQKVGSLDLDTGFGVSRRMERMKRRRRRRRWVKWKSDGFI